VVAYAFDCGSLLLPREYPSPAHAALEVLGAGDLSENGAPEEVEVINRYLSIEYSKITVQKLTEGEQEGMLERWQRKRGLLRS